MIFGICEATEGDRQTDKAKEKTHRSLKINKNSPQRARSEDRTVEVRGNGKQGADGYAVDIKK